MIRRANKTAKGARAAAAAAGVGGGPGSQKQKEEDKRPKLHDFINNRDFAGACTVLEFQKQVGDVDEFTLPWLAYANFHLGEYSKALNIYRELQSREEADPSLFLYSACCLFYLGFYNEAEVDALKGPATRLQQRILMHTAFKLQNEAKLEKIIEQMTKSVDDQLSVASLRYARAQLHEATDIYKQQLITSREYAAVQVYVAMCYYRLEYFDVAAELLQPYLEKFPDSATAINLKACCTFKLCDGRAAEGELKPLTDVVNTSSQDLDNDLVKHNIVVFRNGENALQVLPPLVDSIPEARMNLVLCHLRNGEFNEAHDLIKDLEPTTPHEYIIKAVVHASVGQNTGSNDHLKLSQQYFQVVGSADSERDTIPGRQAMASAYMMHKQYEEVLVYLDSIKSYSANDSSFHFNYGLAFAASGKFSEAEEALLAVQDERLRKDYVYMSWLTRCFIMNGKPRDAWDLYLKVDSHDDSFNLLILIANDCYRVSAFFYAAKAFDVLQRLDPSHTEYWDGKRGACAGVFQQVVAGKENHERLRDVIALLSNNTSSPSPQADLMIRMMTKWAVENNLMSPQMD